MSMSSLAISQNNSLTETTTYKSGIKQATAYRVVKKHTAQFLKEYKLTCMQWFTIGTVLDTGKKGIKISDLASTLGTTLAYMTTKINLLESRGILVKKPHPSDARVKIVTIAPDYKKTCKKIESGLRDYLRKVIYPHISRDELATYIKVLYKLSTIK